MWMMIILACAQETAPPIPEPVPTDPRALWTVESALEPALAAMDRNGDGRIHAAEYQAVRGDAPGFREVDSDGDGVFELDELIDLVETLDPHTWDEAEPPRPLLVESWQGRFEGEAPVRHLSEWMRFLRSELEASEPTRTLPTDEEIQAAAETGRHDSPEVGTVIRSLAPSSATPSPDP